MISGRTINQLIFVFFLFYFILFPVNLFAHKIYIFAWAENGKVFTESKFSSSKWIKNGKIEVQDETGKVLLTGITSDDGLFSFKIPEHLKSDIVIKLDAGMGHKAMWKIDFDEILQANNGGSSKEIEEKKKAEKIKTPSVVNVGAGISIIFIFFLILAYFKKIRQNINDR
jgi:nickel transport protein